MDSITLTFPEAIQVSVQIGDTAYFTNDVNGVDIKEIGVVTAIDYTLNSITCNIGPTSERPLTTSFILFSKTSEVNTSSLTGYYLYTQLRNNSTEYAELFSMSTEMFESSK
jgi:viroplasmin and RNaseH domain-containing protein|tara:strand:- start:686 stop:1018 length:333 start_codon:yes stop_codon:yes gene_type:complete